MKIRDIEVDFDFLDADDVEKFENECKKVLEESENIKKEEMSLSDGIRKECTIINDFFDNVFGEGISNKIFNGKMNLSEHIKAFDDIVKEKVKQQNDLNNTFERYQPNREQRRYNKYHKRNKK